jgi:p-hydroxybenzoic acid efflux pump subunit AaeB
VLALKLPHTGDRVFPYWPQSVENRAAFRTAVAALVATLISFCFHLETPYWSAMSVVIVTNLYTGSIIDKAMMRIIGTIAGAFLGLILASLVVNSLFLYLLSCFFIISVSVYFYHFSKYGYAYLLGALCAFLIISQIAFNPQNAFFVAIWRPVEIAIGVLVSAISAYTIFPNHLRNNVFVQVNHLFEDFSAEFKQMIDALTSNTATFDELILSNLAIKKKLRKATELIGAMVYELGTTQAKIDELRAILDVFLNISRQLQYLLITSPKLSDISAVRTLPVEKVFLAIQEDLLLLQTAFLSSSASPIALQTEQAIAVFKTQFKLKQAEYSAQSGFIYSFILFLEQVNQNFLLIATLLTSGFVKANPQYTIINKQQRIRSDYDLIKLSVKAGLAVLLALGFWLISNWPGGINGIISSLVISVRKNLFDMKNVSIHRLIGCFLGGGLALFALAVVEMTLYDFILVLFFAVWGFSYLMFKWPKYAYIGLQANIAVIISLAQEGGPPILLDPPLQRLAGVVIGIVASLIVANVVWRSDVWSILNRYIWKLEQYIKFNLNHLLLVPPAQKSFHDLASLFWTARGLIESLEDESLTAKKQERLRRLRKKFEALVITQATISYILVTIDKEKAIATAALFDLDLPLYEKKLVMLYEQHDHTGGLGWTETLKHFLFELETFSNIPDTLLPAVIPESDILLHAEEKGKEKNHPRSRGNALGSRNRKGARIIRKKTIYSTVDTNDIKNLSSYINALNQLALRIS